MSHQNPKALLIIDVQQAIDTYSDQDRNNPDAELRIAALLAKWRALKFPVFHIRHASKSKESPYHCSNQFAFGIKALNNQFYSADDVHWLFLSNHQR